MNSSPALDWAQSFENKSESELRAMDAPDGLDSDGRLTWRAARRHAIRMLREARPVLAAPEPEVLSPSPADDDAEDSAEEDAFIEDEPLPASREERMRMLLDRMHDAEIRARQRAAAQQKPLALPPGDAAQLLERQIASSAALIGYLSNYVARTDTDPSVCMSFMDRMTAMLGASANVGKVVGRLRGQVSRSEQNINVNRREGERGRGRG